jgi:hypothetical protein
VLNYQIKIPIDDDFGTDRNQYTGALIPVKGILNIIGDYAIVDPKIFNDKDFFKPILALLNHNKRFKDIDSDELFQIMSKFGNCEYVDTNFGKSQKFNLDNPFDLSRIDKIDNIRIDFNFKHCPLSGSLLIDNGSFIEIHLSPYTKNYWTISETEWWEFTNYLEENLDLSEIRDSKIEEILGDTNPYKNLLRQLGFLVSEERRSSNYFFDSVWRYYKNKGFISQKQANSVIKSLWS